MHEFEVSPHRRGAGEDEKRLIFVPQNSREVLGNDCSAGEELGIYSILASP